jgi:peroxiredoxin
MLKPGDVAPDFKIGNETLYQILAQRRVAVYFFPKAFTPGCTRESGDFREQFESLWNASCAVVGVSTDDQETNDRFRASLDLPFPLVGDPDGAIVRAYDVRWPLVGFAQRVTYLVGQDRRIELARRSELKAGAHADAVCRVVLPGR